MDIDKQPHSSGSDSNGNNVEEPSVDGGSSNGSTAAVNAVVDSTVVADEPGGSHHAACCSVSTRYIHVYQHAAGCLSHEHSSGACVDSARPGVPADIEEGTSIGDLLGKLIGTITGAGQSYLNRNKERVKSDSPDLQSDKTPDEADLSSGHSEPTSDVESSDDTNQDDSFDEDLFPPPPPTRRLWHGIDGVAVMSLGVVIPALVPILGVISCPKRATLVLLNHPLECILQAILIAMVPISFFLLWRDICKNDISFSLRRGLSVGCAIAVAFLCALVSFAAIPAGFEVLQDTIGSNLSSAFFTIGCVAVASGAVGCYLVWRARSLREFSSSRFRVAAYTVVGALLGTVMLVGSEARSFYIQKAEQMALSSVPEEQKEGIKILREWDIERELRMECSDSRAAGLAGLFLPVKHSELPRLYFTVNGKPFSDEASDDFSSMSDEYLRKHVVGMPVQGLTLARSAFNGKASPDALTSTLNWTLVFRNDTRSNQEARAEIMLPSGALISGLTVWKDGEEVGANFAASGKADGNISWVNMSHDSPAIITDLGRGRNLFHCYPISPEQQLKVNIKMVMPLSLEQLDTASLTFPRFIATNFDLEGEHMLSFESEKGLSTRAQNVEKSTTSIGDVLKGVLDRKQLEHMPLVVTLKREGSMRQVAAPDMVSAWMEFREEEEEQERLKAELEAKQGNQQLVVMIDGSHGVRQQIEDVQHVLDKNKEVKKETKKKVKEAPDPKWVVRTISEHVTSNAKRLIVVIDGSLGMKEHMPAIKKALSKIPSSIPVSISVASSETKLLSSPTELSKSLADLEKIDFVGGQDNLQTVVKAAGAAGEIDGGAVLWIHGPQPALNRDIFIMSPFRAQPTYYELALDSGVTDTFEYFKNHGEIGPFKPVQRTASLSADLNDFFKTWEAGNRHFEVSYDSYDELPPGVTVLEDDRAISEVTLMGANRSVAESLNEKDAMKAAQLAVAYKFVSPVSCVAVMNESPVLQGATNGTIGPQGGEAIMGVNTAGTVRVNNLANLEALANLIASLFELSGVCLGLLIIVHAFMVRKPISSLLGVKARFSPLSRLIIGGAIAIAAFSTPGVINWFIASARDANLFS